MEEKEFQIRICIHDRIKNVLGIYYFEIQIEFYNIKSAYFVIKIRYKSAELPILHELYSLSEIYKLATK